MLCVIERGDFMNTASSIKNDNVLIRADRGFSKKIRLKLYDEDGQEYILTGSDRVIFAAKRKKTDTVKAITKNITANSQTEDGIVFTLTATNTDIEPGRYYINFATVINENIQSFEVDGYLLIVDNVLKASDIIV